MAKKNKNGCGGLIFGPILIAVSVSALWSNETRFNYHRAAANTQEILAPAEATADQLFSLTGPMDQSLTIKGNYVESFTGYLTVRRQAEIYAWDREEDEDGDVTWSKRWMGSLESNSRNDGLSQNLSSKRFLPKKYEVGDLTVSTSQIKFVNPSMTLHLADAKITREGLEREESYLYLRKGNLDELGDERVSYSGVPVPQTATYFGKFDGSKGVADTTHQRTGFINQIIMDSGILHHLVAGDRKTALASMKAHIEKVKWITRGIASFVVTLGFVFFFTPFLSFFALIPFLGGIARWGPWLLSLMVSIPLVLFTMVSGYLFAHPFLFAGIVFAIIGIIILLRQKGKSTRRNLRTNLESQLGRELDPMELEELRFVELAQLGMSDGVLGEKERKELEKWAKKNGWDDAKINALLDRATQAQTGSEATTSSEEHLINLIRLALADNQLSNQEFRLIQKAASMSGHSRDQLYKLIGQVRQSATASPA